MNRPAVTRLDQPSARAGLVFALAFAALWGVMELFVVRLHQGYDVIQIEAWRFAVQLVLMLLVWRGRGAPLWHTRRPVSQFTRASLMLAIPLGFEVAVAHGASAQSAQLGLWLAPLWALGLARLWLRDNVPAALWGMALLGGLGAVLLIGLGRPGSLMAVAVSGVMGLALALYLAVTRSLRYEPAQTNLFLLALGSFVLLAPCLPGVWVVPDLHDALLLSAIGVLGYLALWLLEQALRRWSLPHVAPALFAHLACLMLVSAVLRMRWPAWPAWLGLLLVAGVVFMLWRRAVAQDSTGGRTALASVAVLALDADTEGGAL